MTAQTYNDFFDKSPIDGELTPAQVDAEWKKRKLEANKVRSFLNKYLKAYLRGRGSMAAGFKEVEGIKEKNIIKISSNEWDIHTKAR